MTDLLPVQPDELSLQADPVGYMTVVLHRAKGWLVEAQNIDRVRDAKAIAVGYEAVIIEKELSLDAQLAATEIVRRCERRIGQLVREGQEEGLIRRQGQAAAPRNQHGPAVRPRGAEQQSPSEVFSNHKEAADSYAMTDGVSDETYNQAVQEAREEGNLSRANVVRKVKGERSEPARSEWHHKKRHIDSNRIIERFAAELDAATTGLDLIDPSAIDVEHKMQCVQSIQNSIRTIQREMRKW